MEQIRETRNNLTTLWEINQRPQRQEYTTGKRQSLQ